MSTTTITEPQQTEFVPSGDVTATIEFYGSPVDGSSPRYIIEEGKEPTTNLTTNPVAITIHDLRGDEKNLSLDKQAFEVHREPSALSYADFDDDEKVTKTYYPEVQELVKKHVGNAKEVIIFDHTIRRSRPDAPRTPVLRAHIDQTNKSGVLRLKRHIGEEEAEKVVAENRRFQIINVWRPINGTVVAHPLAFADSSTVKNEDIVPVPHIYPGKYQGETGGIEYGAHQKWWYVSGHRTDEVTFIKCFDSWKGEDGSERRTPHTAFVHSGTPEGARGRESIEVRCLIVG